MTSAPRAFCFEPSCSVCGKAAARVELVQQGSEWRFRYEGVVAGNGNGHLVSEQHATLLTVAFEDPPNFDLMRQADLHYDNAGYCPECRLPYCYKHWSTGRTGYGTCPRGHGKSLDPHWSPD